MAVRTRELMGELERGIVFPVYLLLGEDRGTKDLFLQKLYEVVVPKGEDSSVARSVFYGGETAPGEILTSDLPIILQKFTKSVKILFSRDGSF